MLFVVLFEDNPNADPDIRKRLMPDYLAFLQSHAEHVKAAGPLTDQNGSPAGGMWQVEAADADDVEPPTKDDPFWPTGLRESYRVLSWTQVFSAG